MFAFASVLGLWASAIRPLLQLLKAPVQRIEAIPNARKRIVSTRQGRNRSTSVS